MGSGIIDRDSTAWASVAVQWLFRGLARVQYWPQSRNRTVGVVVKQRPALRLSGIVLDALDARELAGVYRRLLGWDVGQDEPEWVTLVSPDGGAGLSFQSDSAYLPPVWPAETGTQQMMLHLDVAVTDLAEA